jgi:hypothetical protein
LRPDPKILDKVEFIKVQLIDQIRIKKSRVDIEKKILGSKFFFLNRKKKNAHHVGSHLEIFFFSPPSSLTPSFFLSPSIELARVV